VSSTEERKKKKKKKNENSFAEKPGPSQENQGATFSIGLINFNQLRIVKILCEVELEVNYLLICILCLLKKVQLN